MKIWLWEMRALFDKLSDSYGKYYSLKDHLAIDEIILLCKVKSYLQRVHTKETQAAGIKF